jgi:hypothetical protein
MSGNGTAELDTVYADIHYVKNREVVDGKLPIISISNKRNESVNLKIGQTDTIELEVLNFGNYETELRNSKNLEIESIGQNQYLLTPTDSSTYFEVWQDYDSGRVILTRFDKNQQPHYSNYNGWTAVGKLNLKAE